MKISLIGYMGSGKSTVGKRLAKTLDIPFIDLDEYIETHEKQSINEIFQSRGEIYFRKKESYYLKSILEEDNFVLSTGGGTPVFYNHMDIINQNTTSYYLYASPGVLAQRLIDEKNHRPKIAHLKPEDMTEFVAKHLFERNPFYQQATHTVNTSNKTIEEIVEEIRILQNQS